MLNYPTILRCSQTTATIVFILIGTLFCLSGCAQFYRIIGLDENQTADQIAKDQVDRQKLVESARMTITEIVSTTIAGLGAIASGFLARALGTERKITKVLITGIESSKELDVKKTVHNKATAAGIEPKLAARVRALT